MDSQFQKLKKKKERQIKPFGELDEFGRDKISSPISHQDAESMDDEGALHHG